MRKRGAPGAAARQRRYRKRQTSGEAVFRVPVGHDVIDWLLESGRLTEEQGLSRDQVEGALTAILKELAK